jgi:hypothetical protein
MADKPLLVGRVLRVLSGLAFLGWLFFAPLSDMIWNGLLLFLGISFLVGGIMAHSGCEITALPNLFLRKRLNVF